MIEPKPKFCIDCRWCYVGAGGAENARCQHPSNFKTDIISLVTGKRTSKYIGSEFCQSQRLDLTECGKAGRFWEPSTGDGVGVDNSK